MRTIYVDNSEDFGLLYQGFLIGGNSQQSKNIQTVRREVKILDKLEVISTIPDSDKLYPTGDPIRELLIPSDPKKRVKLELSTEEHALLKKYFESVPWTTKVSRDVVRLADLLDNAESD